MDATKNIILAYNRPTPRYTSYPPATCFEGDTDDSFYIKSLKEHTVNKSLSLYIHIPFCSQLCYYCGCLTYATKRPERVERYLELLLKEARLMAALLPKGATFEHIHFGGGSPTMLTPLQFERLMSELRRMFSISVDAEIAIEADPRQMSEAKIAAYAKMGVTRMSFGVQDINPLVMKTVNREQPLHLTLNAMQWAREYGISNINIDLMYGLPHQTLDSMRETLEVILTLAPSRIAFFGYAHVPWMKKHMQAMDMDAMPDASLRYDLFTLGSQILVEAGYEAIGIDHFVCPTDSMYEALTSRVLHRNFQGYTTDASPTLIGLGASAISETPEMYAQNTPDVKAYEAAIEAGHLPMYRALRKKTDDLWTHDIIKQLMCYNEADVGAVRRKYHLPESALALAMERLSPLLADGIITWKDEILQVKPHATMLTRLVASAFDAYTPWTIDQDAPKRHAQSV